MSASLAPLNTSVATCLPSFLAAQPKCVSSICPMFIREGTESGFNTISTGVPSGKYGISSSGNIRETIPLLPWRPAILSPTDKRLRIATYTLTDFNTPADNSSPFSIFLRLS